jgi:hypothetical protein
MKQGKSLLLVQIVAGLLALMYLQSAWDFIANRNVAFISWTPADPMASWAVANLGARLLAIGAGFFIALALRDLRLLALMFAVRLVADATDLAISSTTPGIDAFVPGVLAAFVAIEVVCLLVLLRHVRNRPGETAA